MYNSDPPSNTHLNAWQQWAFRIEQRMQEQQDTIEQLQRELELLKQQLSRQEPAPTLHVEKIEYHFDQLKVDTLEGSLQIGLSTSNPEQLPMMIEDIMMQQGGKPSPYDQMNGPHYSTSNSPFANANAQANAAPYVAKPNSNPNYNGLNSFQRPRKDAEHNKLAAPQPHYDAAANRWSEHSELADSCLSMLRSELYQQFVSYISRQGSLMQVALDDEHIKLIVDDIERQLPARIHYYIESQRAKREFASIEQLREQVLRLTKDDIESAVDQYIYQLSLSNQHEEEQKG